MLIFSPTSIAKVRLKIDNGTWQDCDNVDGPLYVSEWNETEFQKGLHYIVVKFVSLIFSGINKFLSK